MITKNITFPFRKFFFLFIALALFASCDSDTVEDEIIPDDEETPVEEPAAENKKGSCMSYNNATWSTRVSRLNAHWHYSWGNELKEYEPTNVEYVPMFWGKNVEEETLVYLKQLKADGKIEYLLGFNEPDSEKQANMTVDQAIDLWPKLETVGVSLGSPAVVGNPSDSEWLKDFMSKAEAKELRVDFVCMHSYGGLNADAFIAKVKEAYDMYGKPIWITEFAVGDWNATSPADNKYTAAQVLSFMKEVLPQLDKLDYVHRYAWYNAKTEDAPLASSILFDENDQLTALGEYYASFDPNENVGAGYDLPVEEIEDDPDNIIVNGTFETGEFEPWDGFKSATVGEATTNAYTGGYCGRIENNDGAIFQIISVEAGKTYEISFYSKWDEDTDHSFAMKIKEEDGAKAILHSLDIPKDTEWVENKTEFTCPEGITNVRFLLYKGKTDPTMPPFYVDNVVVKEKTKDDGSDDDYTDVSVTAISVSPESFDLEKGITQQLIANLTPENSTNQSLTWSSSDEAVATVTQEGLVTAISEGTSDITVKSVDGGFEGVSRVSVVEANIVVTGISISEENASIKVGESLVLSSAVLPGDASNQNRSWTSSDEAIATVNQDGTVTAITEGSVQITVTSEDGNFTKICQLSITASSAASNIIVNGDFETGESSDWGGYKSGAVNDAITSPYEGSYCGRIERNDGSLIQIVDVEAGKTYEISFQSKWLDAASNSFAMKIKDEGGAKTVLHSYDIPTGTDWTANSTEFVCPAGVSRIKFLLYKGQVNPVLPTFFVDNIVLREKL